MTHPSTKAQERHTPGPWRLGAFHKDGSYAVHAKTASIIHATPFDSSAGAQEANARLIAAAAGGR